MDAAGPTSTPQRYDYRVIPVPGPAPDIGRWLWALEDTRAHTLEGLADLAPDLLDWTPPEGGNSIGTLLVHIAVIEMDWLYEEVLEQSIPPEVRKLFPIRGIRDTEGRLWSVSGATLTALTDCLAETRALLRAVFNDMSLEEFRRVRRLPPYDVTPEWVLHHLIQHEAEHRGELGLVRTRAEHAWSGPPSHG